jgi:hypothetical protein
VIGILSTWLAFIWNACIWKLLSQLLFKRLWKFHKFLLHLHLTFIKIIYFYGTTSLPFLKKQVYLYIKYRLKESQCVKRLNVSLTTKNISNEISFLFYLFINFQFHFRQILHLDFISNSAPMVLELNFEALISRIKK